MMSRIIKLNKKSNMFSRYISICCVRNKKLDTDNTADSNEIKNFDNLAKAWWNEDGEMKALHSMNALRVPFIYESLKSQGALSEYHSTSSLPLKDINILDVGCGGGILSEPLAIMGASVTGIDASEELINVAVSHANLNTELHTGIEYINGLLENIAPENPNKYDAVVCSECLEHVIPKEEFLRTCVQVLKPKGSLFLTTINKTTLAWLLGVVGAEYIFNIVPKGTHDWNKFASLHDVQKILEQHNCQTKTIHGLRYNILKNKWSWTRNTSINYALHAIKN